MPTAFFTTLALIPPSMRAWFTDDRKILVVVGGLLFVAVALSFLTVRYWRITRPVPPPQPVRSVPAAARRATPSAATGPIGAAGGPTTGEHLVTGFPVRPATSTAPARPAVAGADHRDADDDWTPRGTGEHERVEPARPVTARPSRAGRKAVLAGRAPEGEPPAKTDAPVDVVAPAPPVPQDGAAQDPAAPSG